MNTTSARQGNYVHRNAFNIRFVGLALIVIALCTTLARTYLLPDQTPLTSADIYARLLPCYSPGSLAQDESCVAPKVHSILKSTPVQTLVDAVSASSAPPAIYANCHGIGHLAGKEAFTVSHSMESALSQCDEMCRGACIHGVVSQAVLMDLGEQFTEEDIAHANPDTIKKIGTRYCAINTSLCHAIGHLLFAQTQEFNQALNICSNIASGHAKSFCYQGVFMESLGNSNSLYTATTNPALLATHSYLYPCNTLQTPDASHACYRYLPRIQEIFSLSKSNGTIAPKKGTGPPATHCYWHYCTRRRTLQWPGSF